MKITPHEKRRHAVGREKNEGLQTKPKLLNLCVALTMQNSDWLFHGNLSTSVKNAPATINTRHDHYKTILRTNNSTEQITRVALIEGTKQKANPGTEWSGSHGEPTPWSCLSQSGNNRTAARLLHQFKRHHRGWNYAIQSKDSHYP